MNKIVFFLKIIIRVLDRRIKNEWFFDGEGYMTTDEKSNMHLWFIFPKNAKHVTGVRSSLRLQNICYNQYGEKITNGWS